MDADVLAAAPDDIGTQPDKTGRRWLVLDTLTKTMGGESKLKGMENDRKKMVIEITKQHAKDDRTPKLSHVSYTHLTLPTILRG